MEQQEKEKLIKNVVAIAVICLTRPGVNVSEGLHDLIEVFDLDHNQIYNLAAKVTAEIGANIKTIEL